MESVLPRKQNLASSVNRAWFKEQYSFWRDTEVGRVQGTIDRPPDVFLEVDRQVKFLHDGVLDDGVAGGGEGDSCLFGKLGVVYVEGISI